MLRILFTTIILGTALALFAPSRAMADLQSDFNSACALGGGTVKVPLNVTYATPQTLTCTTTSHAITVVGTPSAVTCSTGASPCITLGSPNIAVRDLHLVGPGLSIAGSEGIRVLTTADFASLSGIKIDNFDVGAHLIGDASLLIGTRVTDINIGSPGATVNVAVHLDGAVANAYFSHFGLSGIQRVILSDGIGASGAAASFVSGYFNTTTTPGTAGVYVSASDGVTHDLLISDIQDWETACPMVEIGNQGRVAINGVAFSGDPWSSAYPQFKISGSTSVAWLRITNANIGPCHSPAGDVVEVDSPSTFVAVNGSDVYGTVHFVAAGQASITGNRFLTATCLSGSLTNVRAAGNVACADR